MTVSCFIVILTIIKISQAQVRVNIFLVVLTFIDKKAAALERAVTIDKELSQ